jgi:hypothetical protein
MARPIPTRPVRWIPFLLIRPAPAQRLHMRRVSRVSMSWYPMQREMTEAGSVPTPRQRLRAASQPASNLSWQLLAMAVFREYVPAGVFDLHDLRSAIDWWFSIDAAERLQLRSCDMGKCFNLYGWHSVDCAGERCHCYVGGTEPVVNVFDPTVGTSAIASYTNVSSVSVSVTDHPVIVQVGGVPLCGIPLAP